MALGAWFDVEMSEGGSQGLASLWIGWLETRCREDWAAGYQGLKVPPSRSCWAVEEMLRTLSIWFPG